MRNIKRIDVLCNIPIGTVRQVQKNNWRAHHGRSDESCDGWRTQREAEEWLQETEIEWRESLAEKMRYIAGDLIGE
jgi:hypothetical protein